MAEQETEELEALQLEREVTERELGRAAADEHEAAQHERRAQKAHYLQQKLAERAESESDQDR